jgi:hypothetical protein
MTANGKRDIFQSSVIEKVTTMKRLLLITLSAVAVSTITRCTSPTGDEAEGSDYTDGTGNYYEYYYRNYQNLDSLKNVVATASGNVVGDFAPLEVGNEWVYMVHTGYCGYINIHYENIKLTIKIVEKKQSGDTIYYTAGICQNGEKVTIYDPSILEEISIFSNTEENFIDTSEYVISEVEGIFVPPYFSFSIFEVPLFKQHVWPGTDSGLHENSSGHYDWMEKLPCPLRSTVIYRSNVGMVYYCLLKDFCLDWLGSSYLYVRLLSFNGVELNQEELENESWYEWHEWYKYGCE